MTTPIDEPLTAHDAKCLRIALIFGDPSAADLPDEDLERAKAKLLAIEHKDYVARQEAAG